MQKEERFEEALESKDLDPTVALDKVRSLTNGFSFTLLQGSQFWRRKLKEAKQLNMIVKEDKRELNMVKRGRGGDME